MVFLYIIFLKNYFNIFLKFLAGKSKSAIIPDRISRRRLNNSQKGETVKSLKQRILLNVPRTPKKQRGVNPLSFNKVSQNFFFKY